MNSIDMYLHICIFHPFSRGLGFIQYLYCLKFSLSEKPTKIWAIVFMVLIFTLYNAILRIARNFLETRGKHQNFDPSILPYKFGLIFTGMKQKKKNSKWPTQKKLIFQNRQFSKFFRENFSDWFLD